MRTGYIVSMVASVAVIIFFAFQGSYQAIYRTAFDLLVDVAAGVALASAVVAMRRYGIALETKWGRAWLLFAVGILLWLLGEVTWSVYYDVLNVSVPYPSLADVFYLAGYFPIFAGFYMYVVTFRSGLSRRVILGVALAIAASAVVASVLLLGPVLAASEGPLDKVLDFTYPLLDLALLSVALLGLGLLVRGTLGVAWAFFNTAIVLNAVADMLFSYMSAQGTYYTGSFPDLLYTEGYLALALAFYLHRKEW